MPNSTSAPPSPFSACGACVFFDDLPMMDNMKRASVSRRSVHISSPPPRSRSSERWTKERVRVVMNGEYTDATTFADSNEQKDEDAQDRQAVAVAAALATTVVVSPRLKKGQSPTTRKQVIHVRAMSDPFDAQKQDINDDDTTQVTSSTSSMLEQLFLPTLPRYPVSETRNKNCWSESPIDTFQVRGPSYCGDKKKVSSGSYLLTARGCDLFIQDGSTKNPIELEDMTDNILGGQLRRAPTLLINFRFPWGFMAMYFEVPEKLVPFMTKNDKGKPREMDSSFTPPERVLAAWLQGDQQYRNERLKLIPYVVEGPWVVRSMVTGRPAIIGKRLPVTYRHYESHGQHPLLCATLDVGNSTAAAKRIVSVCRRYMSSLTVDIGFVIEGNSPNELPEQMLGAVRIHGPDPLRAVPLRK